MSRVSALWRWFQMRGWRLTTGMTDGELAVIEALLPQGDPRTRMLLLQALTAPKVRRKHVGRGGYRASITSVRTVQYLIEAANDATSPSLAVRDALSGRQLTFTVSVLRGGFLNHLDGVAGDDGKWPSMWSPEALSSMLVNWLPPIMSVDQRERILLDLAEWAGLAKDAVVSNAFGLLIVNPPATVEDIAVSESRLKCSLPTQYKEFVRICNGLSVRIGRPYDILGTVDTYTLHRGDCGCMAVVVTDLYEHGLVVLSCEGPDTDTTMIIHPEGHTTEAIGDLRVHVRDSLRWVEELAEKKGG